MGRPEEYVQEDEEPVSHQEWAVLPLTPDRWPDLQRLFGERGAYGGCWCMWWRQTNTEFAAGKSQGNREALRALTEEGPPPGVIAYDATTPVGWCAIAPRPTYGRLNRSRVLKRLDDTLVWSITCFFVAKPHRRRGLTSILLQAAVDFARQQGASVIEGYPVDVGASGYPDVYAYTGLLPAFERSGFKEVVRRSPSRPIVRLETTD